MAAVFNFTSESEQPNISTAVIPPYAAGEHWCHCTIRPAGAKTGTVEPAPEELRRGTRLLRVLKV
jgi:hypothetical protein